MLHESCPDIKEATPQAPAQAELNDCAGPGVNTADPLIKTLPGANGEGAQKPISTKKESIDLGLEILLAIRPPGEVVTVEAMADACDCSPQRIMQLQARALRNLRRELKRQGIDLADVMHELRE
jgi:hypothetical protein